MARGRRYSHVDSDVEEEDEEEEEEYEERKSARRSYDQQNERGSSDYQKVETHSIFKHAKLYYYELTKDNLDRSRPRIPLSLIAYDGHGRLFVWDSEEKLLCYVEIQRSDLLHSFGGDSGALLAGKDSKTVQLSSPVSFQVLHMVFNRTGRSLVLVGDCCLAVVNLFPPSSTSSSGICRLQNVAAGSLFSGGKGQWLRILQVAWHPYSDSHLGVLSSDGCFRLFDLSLDVENAEQEYHLQPCPPNIDRFAPLARAIAFSFGGQHLWDRFTVFILYSDGRLYALCPVVPFGGMFNVAAVEELAKHLENMDSPSSTTSENSTLSSAWLEAVFPGPGGPGKASSGDSLGGSLVLKAHAWVPLDASLHLQGPFTTLSRKQEGYSDGQVYFEETDLEPCHAVGLLYNLVGKDSVLAISTSDGQVQLYVLADEIEPAWSMGKPPRILADDKGNILAVGMLVEVSSTAVKSVVIGREDELKGTWQGQLPPLLRLASVDLALQPAVLEAGDVSLFADPVVPERLYCQHAAGIDAILLQWLPFSVQPSSKQPSGSTGIPPPSVFPLIDICPTGFAVPRPLLGALLILDSLGESWLVAVTSNCECAVLNIKPQSALPEPLLLEGSASEEPDSEQLEMGVFQMMSKELLLGPKDIPLTQLTTVGAPLTVESIEGRAFLHDQCKLLHEKYIEYSHRVYVELTSHLSRLHDIVQEQKRQLRNAELKLSQAKEESDDFSIRVKQIMEKNRNLEQRVKSCFTLSGFTEKPLTATEMELKSQLDNLRHQDLHILSSAVETLSARAERLLTKQKELSNTSSSPHHSSNHDRAGIPDSQMRRLKTAVQHLSDVVKESSEKVKIIDESVSYRELLKDR